MPELNFVLTAMAEDNNSGINISQFDLGHHCSKTQSQQKIVPV